MKKKLSKIVRKYVGATTSATWPTSTRRMQRSKHFNYATTLQSIYDTVKCAKSPIARTNKHKYIERMCWFGIGNEKSVIMCEVRSANSMKWKRRKLFSGFRFFLFSIYTYLFASSAFVCRRIECVIKTKRKRIRVIRDNWRTRLMLYTCVPIWHSFGSFLFFSLFFICFMCSAFNNFLAFGLAYA